MSVELLRSPAHLSHSEALHVSQQAPDILASQSSWLPWPLSLLTTSDTPDRWATYENLFYSCLRTGDNRSAYICLEKLKERFGNMDERVEGLMGIYFEALAKSEAALEDYLRQHEEELQSRPTHMVVRKRRIALLRATNRPKEATTALVELLEISPIDAEAWAELADVYISQGLFQQAVYSLEEVLLIMPNAWNIHARTAEVVYMTTMANSGEDRAGQLRGLTRSMKHFCRSVELCDNYLRGFYGLKLTTNKLKELLSKSGGGSVIPKDAPDEDFPIPSLVTVQKLNELATTKLAEIIRKYSTGEKDWGGYEESEVIAARELLDRNGQSAPK